MRRPTNDTSLLYQNPSESPISVIPNKMRYRKVGWSQQKLGGHNLHPSCDYTLGFIHLKVTYSRWFLTNIRIVISGEAIQCFQCDSNEDDSCPSWQPFDRNINALIDCTSFEARTPGTFCLKITQQSPGCMWNFLLYDLLTLFPFFTSSYFPHSFTFSWVW